MAFPNTGVHAHICHTINHRTNIDLPEIPVGTLVLNESETSLKEGNLALVGPSAHSRFGSATAVITAFGDCWVSIAREPDAEKGPRFPMKAGERRAFIFHQDYKIAWKKA